MLTLERRNGESLLISPSEDLPKDMTVVELFSEGAIEILLKDAQRGKAKIGLRVPRELDVVREELV